MSLMIHPVDGLAARTDFIPSVKMVKEWIEEHLPRARSMHPEHRLLPPPEEEQVSPEERARRADRLHKIARQIRAVTKAKVVGRPMEWKQSHDRGALLRALDMWTPEKMREFEQGIEG